MKALFSAVIFALLLFNAHAVEAGSCANYPSVCGSYQSAEAVFIGVVQNVETLKAKGQDSRKYGVGQIAHIQVEKSFKGTVQPEVVFVTKEARAIQPKSESYLDRVSTGSGSDLVEPMEAKFVRDIAS